MPTPRLPIPGQDAGQWVQLLNDYLSVELDANGNLRRAADISAATQAAQDAQTEASGKYAKPTGGIPAADLAAGVQTSLGKADAALPGSGGTVSGSLTVGDGTGPRNLSVTSSYAGGDDDGANGHFDSTGRINLYSYQRANYNVLGETVRTYLMRKDAKAMMAWYGPSQLYDANGNANPGSFKPWTWIGSHYQANDHNSLHMHWEVEVPDANGALQGRLEIPFGDRTTGTIGLDKTNIQTNLADFTVRTSNGQVLRLASNNSNNKDIQFSLDSEGGSAYKRWVLRTNATTESGANAGSDLQVMRYDDSGTLLDSPLFIERSTGRVGLGTIGPTAKLHVERAVAGQVAYFKTNTAAAGLVLAEGVDTSVKALQAQVTGDAQKRFNVFADGKHSWGSGATAADTTLYRSAAATLATDGALQVAGANVAGTLFARKAADQAVASNATLAADADLTVNVVAGATYALEAFLAYDGATTGDIAIAWSTPSGSSLVWTPHGPGSSATGNVGSLKVAYETSGTQVLGAVGTGTANRVVAVVKGNLVTATTAGSFTLRWAQGTSDATATTLAAGSYLRLDRVA